MTTIEDPRRRLVVLTGVCAALAAVQASVSALNVAVPDIGADLGATQGELLWVVNGYTLSLAALLLPLGAIGDRWGRKPMLVAGLVLFAIAGLASSQAGSPEALIALRVLSGIGAAMVLPATLSVITSSFPVEHRGTAVGVWAGVAGSGGVLGLLGASFIVDAVTWPWVFTLFVGPALIALVLVVLTVPNSREAREHPYDLRGALLSSAAIGGVVLAIQEGPERGWSDVLTLFGLALGLLAAATWVVTSRRTAEPLLDLRLFRLPPLAGGSLGLLVLSIVSFGVFLVLIQYLLSVLGFSAVRSAACLIPVILLMLIAAPFGPQLAARIGRAATIGGGLLVGGIGVGLIALQADARSYAALMPGLVLFGLGVGIGMAPSTTGITDSLPDHQQGVASAVNDSVRELGGALGIAVLGSLLNAGYRSNVDSLASSLGPDLGPLVRDGITSAQLSVAQLPADVAGPVIDGARAAFVDGWTVSIWSSAALMVVAAVATYAVLRRERTEPAAT